LNKEYRDILEDLDGALRKQVIWFLLLKP